MPTPTAVAEHYNHGSLLDAIREGVARLGKTPDAVSVDDLAPVDEFHIGGRVATKDFLDQLAITSAHRVLDVGCGLGGASRFAANEYGCQVTGIDLTSEYVETGRTLCEWVGLQDRIDLDHGDATSLPYEAGTFDRAFMLHVGMNVADKGALITELHRVVRPEGRVGVYDVMQVGAGEVRFPVPWATTVAESDVATPAAYRTALEEAGFRIVAERNRREFAAEFFTALRARMADESGPPPLGLHIVMGSSAPLKVQNMVGSVASGVVAPVEIVAEKAAT